MKKIRLFVILVLAVFFLAASSMSSRATGLVYQYDQANRLISVEYPSGYRIEYSYDPAGNRSQRLVSIVVDPNDLNGDGDVDGADLALFQTQWDGTDAALASFALAGGYLLMLMLSATCSVRPAFRRRPMSTKMAALPMLT